MVRLPGTGIQGVPTTSVAQFFAPTPSGQRPLLGLGPLVMVK